MVIQADDILKGTELAKVIEGLKGVIIIKDDKIGVCGEVKICPIDNKEEQRNRHHGQRIGSL
jgi:hypothetical protein